MTKAVPPISDATGFFCEFAMCCFDRWLAVVDFSCGQFPQPTLRSMTKLMQQADLVAIVDRDHRCTAWVMNHFQICNIAVRQLDTFDVDFYDTAFVDGSRREQFALHGSMECRRDCARQDRDRRSVPIVHFIDDRLA